MKFNLVDAERDLSICRYLGRKGREALYLALHLECIEDALSTCHGVRTLDHRPGKPHWKWRDSLLDYNVNKSGANSTCLILLHLVYLHHLCSDHFSERHASLKSLRFNGRASIIAASSGLC